jgi:hydroxyethylthiazole kinase-like uncharacterized protein yjeF
VIMAKIATVEQMHAIEKAADAGGLTYAQMMENAGRAVAAAIQGRIEEMAGKRVAILVGPGNNGGDGLVAGHYLAVAGAEVACYLAKGRLKSDANLARLQKKGLPVLEAEADQRGKALREMMQSADIILDALLGTGIRLPLEGTVLSILKTAQAALQKREVSPFVVAVDCPSGLDCDSGEVADEALQANLTVTLAAAKRGLLRFPGAQKVGELVVADIGIPAEQEEMKALDIELATWREMRQLLPLRPRDAHKGTFGRALIVAGSVNFPGAAAMAGEAAYRVGAGLVTLAVPGPVQILIASRLPEATWIILPHEMGVIAEHAVEVINPELGKTQCMLMGPGFGQEAETAAFVAALLGADEGKGRSKIGFLHEQDAHSHKTIIPHCVIDADGLKLLHRIEDWYKRLPPNSILTPHPGEMDVLTGETIPTLQKDRVASARRWARKWGHIVVLKGAFTVVASPEGRATVMPFATAALARAGTGDVLAGTIAGLRAQGLEAYEACILGCYLHGRAGELAAQYAGCQESVLAGDVAECLGEAISELYLAHQPGERGGV